MPKQNISNQEKLSGLEPATCQILFNRGITNEQRKIQFLNPDYEKDLHDPFQLDGMSVAVETALEAKSKKRKVCIYGDYDADGVTASVLLSDFFEQIGLDYFCYIPDRGKEGYGMHEQAIDYIAGQKASLIITVDCGVSNHKEVEYANSKGLEVVILDHHHVPDVLPKAKVIVDPKKADDPYPEKNLAGVGVAFKFVQAMASKLEDYDQEQLKWFLDLVAIGTVADCMTLVGENRTLVKFGLIVLSKTKRTGLKQVIHVGRITINGHAIPTSYQIGFQIGPRINAAGRMDHANIAYDLLMTKENEESKARLLALELEDKNKHRQKVTEVIVDEVRKRIAKKKGAAPVIVESSPNWEFGVIGLAAGKIADAFNCPTILLQEEPDGDFRGSGRSAAGLSLIEVVERRADLVERYGGHAQAIGIKLQKDKMLIFKEALEKDIAKLDLGTCEKKIKIDANISLSEINQKLVGELAMFEPFGPENEKPVFLSNDLLVKDVRVVGNGEKHLKMWLEDQSGSGRFLECIGFRMAQQLPQLKVGDQVNIAYHLEQDNWNGQQKIQGVLVDVEMNKDVANH